jgi:hypothetical protein
MKKRLASRYASGVCSSAGAKPIFFFFAEQLCIRSPFEGGKDTLVEDCLRE